ncbi:hypothetical protein PsorP6_000599 [Peronosclerospora sorghi]|uniref:Uncharacterized protein n=1 Tax=Peronosclerospora sorghi TaxID=230839 RepID=A0ACC0WWT2_9STRA|nr:hypothetical protein PsorP6_000599 [Peronosclerospora sorghi]
MVDPTIYYVALVLALATASFFHHPHSSSHGGRNDVDRSDGTDVRPRQPLLSAKAWFLTEHELTQSRGGIPRDNMQVYTTGNNVTALTVSRDFFNAVYDDLCATKAGDRVLLSAWLAALVPLKPDVDPSGNTTGVLKVFTDLVHRGTNVNVLAWANIDFGYTPYILHARDAINAIAPSRRHGAKAVFLFDDRLPSMTSHHQKFLVLGADTSTHATAQPVAYVGGIDLAMDRWDTITHNALAIRDAGHITFHNQGWIDGHVRIHGPAAKDVAQSFLERWNSRTVPSQGLHEELLDFTNPPYAPLRPLSYASSNRTGVHGTHSVQIVRTFSCLYDGYEFAPRGETSLFAARVKAIKNARNFIYIEDQYFILVPELLAALLDVLPHLQRVVVLVNAHTSPFANVGYIKYFYDNVAPLRARFPRKFQIYTVKPARHVLVHTKLVIIDDVYVSIGSANWNRRSMTSDTELNADIVDTDTIASPDGVVVGKLPRHVRLRKFQEWTGLRYDELEAMTFVEAADHLREAVHDNASLLANHTIEEKAYFFAITESVRKIADPQDTCDDDGRKRDKDTA